MAKILLYSEITKDNYVHTVVFELAAKALELAQKLGDDSEICALLICKSGLIDDFKDGFINSGFDKVYVAQGDELGNYSTAVYSKIALDIINDIKPDIVLFGATVQGRDLAPRIAAGLHTGLTADCTGLDINEQGKLAATRPTFGGKLMATILCKTLPQMATVRPKVFKPADENCVKDTQFIYYDGNISEIERDVEIIEFVKGLNSTISELDSAEIIVSGGRGMANETGFELLKELANLLGASVGASRDAVEMGLATSDMQIGQTGKTVSPKLYIACGISGAIQHLVGISGADKILAVNKDKNAPIFSVCNYGIVGDVFEVLPKIIDILKRS